MTTDGVQRHQFELMLQNVDDIASVLLGEVPNRFELPHIIQTPYIPIENQHLERGDDGLPGDPPSSNSLPLVPSSQRVDRLSGLLGFSYQ